MNYKKQLLDLKKKSQKQSIDLTTISENGVFFDYREHKPILFGKDAVEFMRKHYNQIIPLIYTCTNGKDNNPTNKPFEFEGFKLVAGVVNNPSLITQHIVFQLENGYKLVWPHKYSDDTKFIYPLLGVQS